LLHGCSSVLYVCPSIYLNDTSGKRDKAMKRSTLGIRRSKVKVSSTTPKLALEVWQRSFDPFLSSKFSSIFLQMPNSWISIGEGYVLLLLLYIFSLFFGSKMLDMLQFTSVTSLHDVYIMLV